MDKLEVFKNHVIDVVDFPKKGIVFKDITPLLEDGDAFRLAIDEMAKKVKDIKWDKIICADARGFLFGSALSYKTNKGFVIARKPNKLPRPGITYSYDLEYGQNTLVISEGSIKPGEKYLVVDDLLATGGSAEAMCKMVKQKGGEIVSSIFFIELKDINGRKVLENQGISVHSLIEY